MPNKRADGMRVRSFAVLDDLWHRAVVRAKVDGVTVSEVVREALRRYLK